MSKDRQFAAGLIIGAAASLIPSLPETREIYNERPAEIPLVVLAWGLLIAAIWYAVSDVA